MDFWDFSAPIYDIAEKTNKKAYSGMVKAVYDLTPPQSEVLECAAGTGSISLAVTKKAKKVICTDLSENMLKVARGKASKENITNICFESGNICDLKYENRSFDVVIASQVLHLLDDPQKAVEELKRVSKNLVITPVCLLEDLSPLPKVKVEAWKLLGFAPKQSFSAKTYREFLTKIGLKPSRFGVIQGQMPMAIGVYKVKK